MAYTEAFAALDVERAATYMHPEALEGIKTLVLDIAKLDTTGLMLGMMFGVDQATVQEMDGTAVYKSLIGAVMRLQPQMEAMMSGMQAVLIGHVNESEDLVHVLTRTRLTVMGEPLEQVQMLSLKRDGDTWKMLLDSEYEAMMVGIRAQLKADQ